MKKYILKWQYLLLIILVFGFSFYRFLGFQEENKIRQAIAKVKKIVKIETNDKLTGCIIPNNKYTFVQINRDLLLAIDGQKIFIPNQGQKQNQRVKQRAPELPVLNIDFDPYEISENCYLQ